MSGFMKKMSAAASSATNSAKIVKAKAGLKSGIAYNSSSFRAAFSLPDSEPLLMSFSVLLLSGEVTMDGQIYLTPHLMCIYTIANSKEVKLKIGLHEVENVINAYCANTKVIAPAVTPVIPIGEKPNVLQVLCTNQVMHTMLNILPADFDYISAILHVTWDITRGHTASTMPVPPAASPAHTSFRLHESEPLLSISKATIINGTEKLNVELCVFIHYVGFKVGDTPVLLDYRHVSNIAKCSTSPHPDPLIKTPVLTPVESADDKVKGLVLYTDDGFMHQFYSISDMQLFYNQLVFCHALQNGFTPAFW